MQEIDSVSRVEDGIVTADRRSVFLVHSTRFHDVAEIRLGREHTSSKPDSVSLDDVLIDFRLDSFSILVVLLVGCGLALVAEAL
jgi:hypothetical protein